MKTSRTLSLGSISTSTLRMEDLLPTLLDELSALRLTRAERATVRDIRKRMDAAEQVEPEVGEREPLDYFETDDAEDDYETLCDIANDHTPDYCYFGSHEDDGADIGVWPVEDLFLSGNRDGGYDGHIGHTRDQRTYPYALEVNDHGNATLYRRAGRRWIEVWSIV